LIKYIRDNWETITAVMAWFSWLGSFVLTVYVTTLPLTHPNRQYGILIIFWIGVAIASGLSLGRHKLARTIGATFDAGLKAATALQANVMAPAAVVEVDFDGKIVTVEHSEVIGWTRGNLHGRQLEELIPDRFLRSHRNGFARFKESGDSRVAGATLSVPVLTQNGEEMPVRLTVARLGDTFVGTLVPLHGEEADFYEDDRDKSWSPVADLPDYDGTTPERNR
jgi:PAS domain S-box-containing protein